MRAWVVSPLALLAFVSNAAADTAAPTLDPSIGKIEVTLDLPRDKPYVGEMIMLHMRSFIRADILLDQIRQPPLVDFDLQQLGRDKPIEAMVDGYQVQGIERDLAIFPEQSGRLIIGPFDRHVTVARGATERIEGDFTSKPLYVDVQNYSAINPPGAWWLPVKSLSLTEAWAPQPDEIPHGALTRRTVTVEAVGITADRLPPPPEMHAPGVIVFRGPEQRETIVTEDGPVARAVYRWDLRPATGAPAKLPAIEIPWFDTGERRIRGAAIPERWVAYLGTFVHTRHEKLPRFRDSVLKPGPIAAGLVSFAWTAALVGFVLVRDPRDRGWGRSRRLLSRLQRTARFRDEPGFCNVLAELARRDPARWSRVAGQPELAERLAAFNRARYGGGGDPSPALAPLAADLCRAWRDAGVDARAPTADAMPQIDGEAIVSDKSRRDPLRWIRLR